MVWFYFLRKIDFLVGDKVRYWRLVRGVMYNRGDRNINYGFISRYIFKDWILDRCSLLYRY